MKEESKAKRFTPKDIPELDNLEIKSKMKDLFTNILNKYSNSRFITSLLWEVWDTNEEDIKRNLEDVWNITLRNIDFTGWLDDFRLLIQEILDLGFECLNIKEWTFPLIDKNKMDEYKFLTREDKLRPLYSVYILDCKFNTQEASILPFG